MLATVKNFLKEEDGVGSVEIILILLVLVGLVLVFKYEITKITTKVFKHVNADVDKLFKN